MNCNLKSQISLEIYQWLVPLVALVYMTRVILQYRRRRRLFTSTFFWIVFWIAISALAIVPNQISQGIANLLGFKSNVNAIIFVALGFLFSIVFYLSAAVERLERQMTDLIRKIALENATKNDIVTHVHNQRQVSEEKIETK